MEIMEETEWVDSKTAIDYLFGKWMESLKPKWEVALQIAERVEFVYGYLLKLPSSPAGKNFLELQITNVKERMASIRDLNVFFILPTDPRIQEELGNRSQIDLNETAGWYDAFIGWLSQHVSRVKRALESFRKKAEAGGGVVGLSINEEFNFISSKIPILVLGIEKIGRVFESERQYLGAILSIHMQIMIVILVKQRHTDKCSLCLTDFKLDESTSNTPCNHLFHTRCLTKWFEKKKTCPRCRNHCFLIDVPSIQLKFCKQLD